MRKSRDSLLPYAGDNEIHKSSTERVADNENREIHDVLLCGVESNVHRVITATLCKAWAMAVVEIKFLQKQA